VTGIGSEGVSERYWIQVTRDRFRVEVDRVVVEVSTAHFTQNASEIFYSRIKYYVI
jgi:hypothetical protein